MNFKPRGRKEVRERRGVGFLIPLVTPTSLRVNENLEFPHFDDPRRKHDG